VQIITFFDDFPPFSATKTTGCFSDFLTINSINNNNNNNNNNIENIVNLQMKLKSIQLPKEMREENRIQEKNLLICRMECISCALQIAKVVSLFQALKTTLDR
jgi:hypothetical protein